VQIALLSRLCTFFHLDNPNIFMGGTKKSNSSPHKKMNEQIWRKIINNGLPTRYKDLNQPVHNLSDMYILLLNRITKNKLP